MKLEGRLTSYFVFFFLFLNHGTTCISAAMASAMPDKEEAAKTSLEVKEEQQQVGAACEMQ